MTIDKIMNKDISDISKIMNVNINDLSKFMGIDVSAITYEDFTTYIEVDEDSDITVTQFEVSCVTMRRDALSYVRKDFGAAYFGDFEVEFDFHLGASTGSALVSVFALSNGANTCQQMMNSHDGLAVAYQDVEDPQNKNRIYASGYEVVSPQDYYETTFPLWRYITAYRTGDQFYVKIYSNSDRTVLLDTLQVQCGTTTYRYLYALSSRESSILPADTITTTVANLKIISH